MAAAEDKAASVPHADLLALEHSADVEGPLHGGILGQAVVHGHIQPRNGTSSTSVGAASHRDILSFLVCPNSLKRPQCPPKTAHHMLPPCLRHLCPVLSPYAWSRLLSQRPTYLVG